MIRVFEPDVGEEEIAAVAETIRAGEISGSFGETIPAFEREFASFVGAEHGVAVTSGTAALHLAAAAAGLAEGDEVLISACTNVATALAPFHLGAMPVPVDSEPHTRNLDLDLLPSLLTNATRAVIPVHLFGHPVDMDRLMDFAEAHELVVIEDCAESHGATVRGRMTGSFGHMGCFSFYANKVITTGEGGMVVTDDDELADRLRTLRNLAFGVPRFVHEHAGFNFRMTGYQAAMGRVQLRKIDATIVAKRRLAEGYNQRLSDVDGVITPIEREWAKNVYWMYAIELAPGFPATVEQVAEELLAAGIETRRFFYPMSRQPFLRRTPGFGEPECPVADALWERGLYLPSATNLTEDQITYVADHIRAIGGRSS